MTVNEFVKNLAKAGFDFSFRASDGNISVVGQCVRLENNDFKIMSRRLQTVAESREKINRLLNGD
jgi:hypothetical protein